MIKVFPDFLESESLSLSLFQSLNFALYEFKDFIVNNDNKIT